MKMKSRTLCTLTLTALLAIFTLNIGLAYGDSLKKDVHSHKNHAHKHHKHSHGTPKQCPEGKAKNCPEHKKGHDHKQCPEHKQKGHDHKQCPEHTKGPKHTKDHSHKAKSE